MLRSTSPTASRSSPPLGLDDADTVAQRPIGAARVSAEHINLAAVALPEPLEDLYGGRRPQDSELSRNPSARAMSSFFR